jgi:hypothetical protein
VVPGRSGWPEAWDYSVDGRSIRIGRAADGWAPVMQLKLWHPLDDWYGLSPLEAAAQGVDAHNAAGAWNKALLDNGARPSGARIYGAKGGERLTDGVAMLVIAACGVSTYASEQTGPLIGLGLAVAAGLVVLSSRRLMHGTLDVMDRLPVVGRLSPRLRLMVDAAQTCLAPRPLLFTVAISVVAWLAECVAYWQTFAGFGVPVDAAGAIYIYASSTILGAPSPGGLGVTDGAMAVGAMTILGVERGVAVPAALIARTVTLWMGVLLGALALIRVSTMLGGEIALEGRAPPPAAP